MSETVKTFDAEAHWHDVLRDFVSYENGDITISPSRRFAATLRAIDEAYALGLSHSQAIKDTLEDKTP